MNGSERRRRVLAVGALAAIVALAVGSWLIGSRIQSPGQAAARAAPPPRSLITAPVEFRVLAATMITRADIVPAMSTSVMEPASAAGGQESDVVTGVFVARGDMVEAGATVVEVAGRPVFVFSGTTPAFRAMRPGMTGADVAQLQAGLLAAGCTAGDSGSYDEPTKECIEQMYTNAGYTPARGSESEVSDLAAGSLAVTSAEDALANAQNALATAAKPQPQSVLSAARAARDEALRTYDSAVRDQQHAIDDTTRDGADQVASTGDSLRVARLALSDAAAASDSTASAVAGAQAAVNDAQRAYDTAVQNQPRLIADAVQDGADSVATASGILTVATDTLAELEAAPDLSAQTLVVAQQQQALDAARQNLVDLQAVSGAVVPFGEIVFVPQLPARVDSVTAVVGHTAGSGSQTAGSDALVVLSSPALEADVSIPQTSRSLVQDGTPVELLDEATGDTLTGSVRSIATTLTISATSGAAGFPAVIDASFPEQWSGLNVRATVTAASTDHDVLVVPIAAVSSAATGRTRVQVERSDGTVDIVDVTTGLSADGFIQVTPTDPALLVENDRVVIG